MQTMTSQLDRNNSTKKVPRGLPGAFRSAPVVGRILGPLLALAVYFLLPEDPALTADARSVAAVATLIAIWWMTEALPLAVTSLLPLVLLPLTGAVQVSAAAAPYASPIVFLFMGGFVIALSLQRWNLHRRIALLVLRAVGTRPRTIVLGIMVATGFLSMWVNNTATTVMMIPIPVSGIFRGVEGLSAARDDPHITGIEITAQPGQLMAPPPEGASYLGFIFSRAATPAEAEAALRAAHAALELRIQPLA